MGADQRVVITSEIGHFSRPGVVDPAYITCTEPSPEVAKALANATNVAANIADQGNLAFANSQATALAQLAERTAAVQLLRERLYQACVAYKNGAISGVTYTLLMTRLDDAMITMLLGETAGGAFGRSGATVAASTGGSTSAVLPVLLNQLDGLDEAVKKVEETRVALETKQEELQQQQEACERELEAEAAKNGEDRQNRNQIQSCTDSDTLEREVVRLSAELKVLTDALQGQITASASAVSAISNVSAMGGIEAAPDPEIAAILEQMQDNFLSGDVTAFVIPACLVELGLETTAPPTQVVMYEQALGRWNSAQQRLRELEDRSAATSNEDVRRSFEPELTQARREEEEAQRRLENLMNQLSQALQDRRLDDTGSQYQVIFENVLREWQRLSTPEDRLQNLVFLAEAAAATRRSSLASFCVAEMPSLVQQLGRNAQSLRRTRLQYERDIAIARAGADTADAQARMYRAFTEAFALCDQLPETERGTCRSALLPLRVRGISEDEEREAETLTRRVSQ